MKCVAVIHFQHHHHTPTDLRTQPFLQHSSISKMKKHALAQVTPSYSHSSRASSIVHDHAFLYDDYAREIPHVNTIASRYSIIEHEKEKPRLSKRHSPLYIVTLLALVVFVVQLGGSLADVPSTRLLEGLICNEYYRTSSGILLSESHCGMSAVQGESNVITTGSLILGYLPGELQVSHSSQETHY